MALRSPALVIVPVAATALAIAALAGPEYLANRADVERTLQSRLETVDTTPVTVDLTRDMKELAYPGVVRAGTSRSGTLLGQTFKTTDAPDAVYLFYNKKLNPHEAMPAFSRPMLITYGSSEFSSSTGSGSEVHGSYDIDSGDVSAFLSETTPRSRRTVFVTRAPGQNETRVRILVAHP